MRGTQRVLTCDLEVRQELVLRNQLELPETKQVEVPRVLILHEISQFLADFGILSRLELNAFDDIGLAWTRLERVEGRHLEGCFELGIAGEC